LAGGAEAEMKDIELRAVGREEWLRTAPSFADYNYRQTWEFGVACAERMGAASEHVVIRAGNEVIACADVRVKRIPFARTGIAYVNGGPLTRKKSDAETALRTCLKALVKEYVQERCMVLRICPVAGNPEWNTKHVASFRECGFDIAGHMQPSQTILLAIDRPVEEIRASMHQKWRNCLNSAYR